MLHKVFNFFVYLELFNKDYNMQNIVVKVYGFLRPCSAECFGLLRSSLRVMGSEADEVLNLQGELLNVAYEGAYFPVEDFLAALAPFLEAASIGKVDYLDMEAWRITRYNFENGFITSSSNDLNNALAYSGH